MNSRRADNNNKDNNNNNYYYRRTSRADAAVDNACCTPRPGRLYRVFEAGRYFEEFREGDE